MTLPDHSPLEPFVDKLSARSVLGEAERDALRSLPAYPQQLQTNRDFVRLGERVDHACFVVAGLIGRFGQSRDGSRQITAVHIPADMVDLHSVVAPEACSALQALCFATILRVPHRALRDVAYGYPAIAEAFWRECVVDASVLSEWMVNIGRRDARSRLAHLLCEVACRLGGAGRQARLDFDFPATQAHIADMLGLTSVHVNRVFKVLRRDQVIACRGRNIRILDWSRLVRIGDFDPAYLRIGRSIAQPRTPHSATAHLEMIPALLSESRH